MVCITPPASTSLGVDVADLEGPETAPVVDTPDLFLSGESVVSILLSAARKSVAATSDEGRAGRSAGGREDIV